MCGIIVVAGGQEVAESLLDGLRRLEYRGYDSAGVAMAVEGGLWRARAADGTDSLELLGMLVSAAPYQARSGIGHTRWATHGPPTEPNAHPHFDCRAQVAVVHNGIVENHRELRAELVAAGHVFASETDTEVLAHLLEQERDASKDLVASVRRVIAKVLGAFALAFIDSREPEVVVVARRTSPLVIGRSASASWAASDIPALIGRADEIFVLGDDEIGKLRPEGFEVWGPSGQRVHPGAIDVDWDATAAGKEGFDTFMLKEIHEQPAAVADTLRGRLSRTGALLTHAKQGSLYGHELPPPPRKAGEEEQGEPERVLLDGVSPDLLDGVRSVFLVGCGSAYHACMAARYGLERWVRLPVEVEIASELRARDPVLDDATLLVAVSQSGETMDTLQALQAAARRGARTLAVTNVVGSSLSRDADGVLYTRAGQEVGVAATKTFLAQLVALDLLALRMAGDHAMLAAEEEERLIAVVGGLPELVRAALERGDEIESVAEKLSGSKDFFFLGRHVGYPVALEGALKLKEIAYLRAEGFAAGELKHGPIALIRPGSIVVGVATRNPLWPKMMSNVAEVKARGATVVLVAEDGDLETQEQADHVLGVPAVAEPLFSPVVDAIPLQLLAYWLSRLAGHDVDRPRNLAKTVTVE